MPKRITITPHLSLDELETRYREAQDGVERSHYQIIWLLTKGKSTAEVAEVTGYSRGWIYELVWGYNRQGAETLGDGRHHNPGAPPLMDDLQQANLLEVLQGPAPDGGLWNGRKVADYLSGVLERPISRQQGWEYLRQMGWRQRIPRPQHQESDPEVQQEWKKNSTTRLRRSKPSIPTPTLKSGAKMNIASANTPSPDESGLNRVTLPF